MKQVHTIRPPVKNWTGPGPAEAAVIGTCLLPAGAAAKGAFAVEVFQGAPARAGREGFVG